MVGRVVGVPDDSMGCLWWVHSAADAVLPVDPDPWPVVVVLRVADMAGIFLCRLRSAGRATGIECVRCCGSCVTDIVFVPLCVVGRDAEVTREGAMDPRLCVLLADADTPDDGFRRCALATTEGILGDVTAANCGCVVACIMERGADEIGPVGADDGPCALPVDAPIDGDFIGRARSPLAIAEEVLGMVSTAECACVVVCVVESSADATGPVSTDGRPFASLADTPVDDNFITRVGSPLDITEGILGVVAATERICIVVCISVPGADATVAPDAIIDPCK